ncbi:oligosaccharide flippase family protein [Luteolibacter sp. LG18]|uniref:lipopolysaccharide biosynthesis protein n=1 Tax=Luteolibacter sp. LG18 TaxID=2819286 RepID=UPI002B31F9A1|nr:hypothetical protein llg_42890 [Luteolibacter sp. LG18]
MAEWKRRFWSNTASSYAGVVVRMLTGLVLFRTMFQTFDQAEFGFWSLLWSLFGYGILLDFGFGFTAQKAVAEKNATGDIAGLSRLLATIFWTFVILGIVMMVTLLACKEPFLRGVDVAAAHHDRFARAYTVFFVGMAVMFPLGVFPEILRGLQRIDLANWISLGSTLLNFAALSWGLHAGWDFSVLMGISVATSALPNLGAVVMAFRRLPGLSLSPRLFEWRTVRAQMGFSVAAYLITFSNLVMSKSDQLVLSLVVGVGAVAVYQAGYKMAEMLNLFSVQLQAALSPAAADLKARGDSDGLRELLLRSSRLTFLLVTPAYALSAVYLEPLIRVLTGMKEVPHETWCIGQVLLLAIYSSQLTNSCSKRMLMMCGDEKILLLISIGDAFVNLVLSIILAWKWGVLGVAVGTMIPTVAFGWLAVIPLTLRRLSLGLWRYVAEHFHGTALPLGGFGVVLACLAVFVPFPAGGGFFQLAWRGAVAGVPLVALGMKTLKSITR